jgi:hypothetical protein
MGAFGNQVKDYEQDMKRMKRKMKKRVERERTLLAERPSSSHSPSEYGEENLGPTLKALALPAPPQPSFAGRHRDGRYD